MWSIEAINADGSKDSLKGAPKRGGFHPLGKIRGASRVLIAEGLANAAVGLAVDGSPAAAAMGKSNLLQVALAVRKLEPEAEIIFLADNDLKVPREAQDAARAVGGRVAVPDLGGRECDFWDLWHERGAEAVRRAMAGGDGFGIVALEIGELLAREFPPKEMLITPWLRKQDLLMFYAKRGVGKTHFSLSLAYAVASGGEFLKWQAPEARRVLYIDGEMPGVAIQERLAALVDANEKEPPEGFFRIVTPDVQPFSLPDLATAEGQSALDPLIGDAELIVLDNLSTLMRQGVENEGESWVPMATWALARRREGRAVVFVHHAGKGGQQRGSSRREDLLDVVLCLRHPSDYMAEQGARFEVVFEKARGLLGKEVETIEATLKDGADGKTSWAWKAAGATVDRVTELHGLGMKPAEIAVELGVHRSTVYRALKGAGK